MTDKQTLAQSLRRYGSDFISHPVSRGIEDIEAAGELMLEAARVLAEQPAEQQQQEPVAWMCSNTELMHKGYQMFSATGGGDWNIPVYTAPQPRRNVTYVCPCCHFSLERQE